jgi:alpha-L-rhamnosidase
VTRVAWQTDKYTLAGTGYEFWTPRFTWHGFRYAEFNCSGAPTIVAVEGYIMHTDIANALPVFQTSR